MLNYKEHLSKSSHARPDENSIGMFFCTFRTNIYLAHKYLLSYHFLYKLQEHDNKAMYILTIYQWSFSLSSSLPVGYNIDSSSNTICAIAVTCSEIFMYVNPFFRLVRSNGPKITHFVIVVHVV
ncbi:hypothetical protein M9H77_17770 [Catharanthus roseus]|uniref:Uncharacterized protein n=1 Tax=Catharanthus roseus TaxID=4058 RepID=A0ACC0B5L1_CATRO|nr:hypothetical protein M9H77_17770 [Catharanthus roseus]